jgi:phosphoribosyl-ATP pyrophosphohydrolase
MTGTLDPGTVGPSNALVADILAQLERTIADRQGGDPRLSYVAGLLAAGPDRAARKLGEEAIETVIAALSGDRPALTAEAADLVFHLLVLLRSRGVAFADVLAELDRREGVSGLAEKAARTP